jgi:CTP:molybdopterin cytidylyltransferase MocA
VSAQPLHRIGVIVLAAGSSTRLGHPKQLIEHEGLPLVRRAAMAATDAGAAEVIVVVGSGAQNVVAAIGDIARVSIALNPDWESGMASSLTTGLKEAQALDLEAVMVMTTDQPLIDIASLRQLMAAFDDQHRIIASSYDDIVGVPVVFGSEHFDTLMKLKGDEGAGRWLRARLKEVTQIEVQSASVDIDTPADVANLKSGNFPDDA